LTRNIRVPVHLYVYIHGTNKQGWKLLVPLIYNILASYRVNRQGTHEKIMSNIYSGKLTIQVRQLFNL